MPATEQVVQAPMPQSPPRVGELCKHASSRTALVDDMPPSRIRLPCFRADAAALTKGPRTILSFSVLAQMNTILYAFLGVVLERDVLALTSDVSYNVFKGWKKRESLASFVGLYWGRPQQLPSVVAMMRSHLACGLVILPPGYAGKPGTVFVTPSAPEGVSWLDFVFRPDYLKLSFELPGGCSAVFLSFHSTWKFKSKRRPEKDFVVCEVSRLEGDNGNVLGVVPNLLTRASPCFASGKPSSTQDSAPCVGPQTGEPDVTLPSPESCWNVETVRAWAASYPDAEVARIASEAVGEGLDPGFVGSLSKSVIRPNPTCAHEQVLKIREEVLEEVKASRIAGPFCRPPFKFLRNCPLRMIPKDPHDPVSTRMRLISNFSAGAFSSPRGNSVNDLCASPKLIEMHLRPKHLRDVIASKGPGTTVWAADIPKCFRRQKNLKKLLPLFVYLLESQEFGLEYFVDLMNPFGWTPAQYGWQCILAVLIWRFRQDGVTDLYPFVDNFFKFFGPGDDASATVSLLMSRLTEAGISLHEVQEGYVFKGLGWWWDLRTMSMTCTEDKHALFCALLLKWSGRSPLVMSLPEVRSAVGFMTWLSAGFHSGAANVASLVGLRTKMEAIAAKKHLQPGSVESKLSDEQAEALLFWAEKFPIWDRSCPIILGFTSASTWEILGQSDASTDWGCGGVALVDDILWGYAKPWTVAEREFAFVSSRESTGVLELLGALEWFHRFGQFCILKRVQLEMDNEAAVHSLSKLFSPKPNMCSLVRRVRDFLFRVPSCVRVVRVLGMFIKIADALSHNRVAEARCLAESEFGLQLRMA